MKYYCLVNQSIPLVKLTPTRFFDNLPLIGTPVFGKLPITEAKMRKAFALSSTIILCESLEAAQALRSAKTHSYYNIDPTYFKGAIAQGYPVTDYAIYEIEIDESLLHSTRFENLRDLQHKQLKKVVPNYVLHTIEPHENINNLPDIKVCSLNKSAINPRLIKCHYFPIEHKLNLAIRRLPEYSPLRLSLEQLNTIRLPKQHSWYIGIEALHLVEQLQSTRSYDSKQEAIRDFGVHCNQYLDTLHRKRAAKLLAAVIVAAVVTIAAALIGFTLGFTAGLWTGPGALIMGILTVGVVIAATAGSISFGKKYYAEATAGVEAAREIIDEITGEDLRKDSGPN